MKYNFRFGEAADATFGNAIMSKYSILQHSNHLLQKLKEEERRSMLCITVDHPQLKDVKICVTHLDQKHEEARVRELESIFSELKDSEQVILLGDFNSLDLSDYSHEFLAKINKERNDCKWEECRGEITSLLKERKYKDCWKDTHNSIKNPKTISRGTRIDYIWTHNFPLILKECSNVEFENNPSDHDPVQATFGFKE